MKRLRKTHRLLGLLFGLTLVLVTGSVAWAHPLGNFTISRYSELTAEDTTLVLFYAIDMAEIPTFQEQPLLDTDGDGAVSQTEANAYREQQASALLSNLTLQVNGKEAPWTLTGSTLTFPPGQGDLDTMRLELTATATLPGGATADINYTDGNFEGRLGWSEVVITTADGQLLNASVPASSVSDRLHAYPADLLQAPLEVTGATARYVPSGVAVPSESPVITTVVAATASSNRFSTDEFGNLLSRAMDTPSAIAAVLVLAVILGAAHALTPGHGKTIVGAYLVGSRGTARHAVLLGLTTTVTHTAGVFALGLIVLAASRYIVPEKLFPWLGVASGVMVALIGFSILRGHISHWRTHRSNDAGDDYHFHFGFGHSHEADTAAPEHTHDADHEHSHEQGHEHSHDHDHSHDHEHADGHTHSHDGDHVHADSEHVHADGDPIHDHGHDHVPAILTSGEPISMRGLLALGISGGMIPCPSALVLLLSAIALGQVGTGLVLIAAFSTGLAGVLTAIGITMVYAGKALDKLPMRHSVVTQRLLPIASATFITVAGSVIAIRAFMEMKMF